MANKPALIGSMGDSLRESCGKALTSYADKYENIVILDADIAGGTWACIILEISIQTGLFNVV